MKGATGSNRDPLFVAFSLFGRAGRCCYIYPCKEKFEMMQKKTDQYAKSKMKVQSVVEIMGEAKTGFIYVLTNESFHRENWIKIGYAEDVEKRVKELSGTAVPLPYEVYCTYEIPRISGVKDPDKLVHDLIQTLNPNLRISQNREFFELYPWDAYNMLFAIAQMHERLDKLHRNEDNKSGVNDQNDVEYSVENLFPMGEAIYPLYVKIREMILSIDSSLEETPRLNYLSYKLGKTNVISLWPRDGWIELVLGAKLGTLNDENGLTYDISNRKWSAAQYALKFYDDTNIEATRDLILQTYNLKRR